MRDNLHIIRTPKDRSDEKNIFSYTAAINAALVEYYDDPGITIRVLILIPKSTLTKHCDRRDAVGCRTDVEIDPMGNVRQGGRLPMFSQG